jgi:hypothetical protein
MVNRGETQLLSSLKLTYNRTRKITDTHEIKKGKKNGILFRSFPYFIVMYVHIISFP